ncbi:MAG: ankyrin repeat domain-containing protein [Armatimonadetes bacterium]|nr:ankyrin repeat domain-containing protein [Armatimonadota bacterium]
MRDTPLHSKRAPIALFIVALTLLVGSNLYRSRQSSELITLIRSGKSSDALKLVATGVRLNTTAYEPKVDKSLSLLACAIYYKQGAVSHELLRLGVQPDPESLHYAIENNMTDIALELLEKGAKADQRPLFGAAPLLLMAVRNDNLSLAQMLLSKGAEGNAFNNGATLSPVVVASQSPRTALLQLLLKSGASPNFTSFSGDPPLTAAVKHHRLENLKLLIKYHAHIDVPDARGWSPLMYAVESRDVEAIRLLLQNHATPRFKGMTEQSVFTLAKGSPQILRLLTVADAKTPAGVKK